MKYEKPSYGKYANMSDEEFEAWLRIMASGIDVNQVPPEKYHALLRGEAKLTPRWRRAINRIRFW